MITRQLIRWLVPAVLLLWAGCYSQRCSRGGGQTAVPASRTFEPADVALPAGYRIELVASGLTFPTGIAFDSSGQAYVTESGYAYGEVWLDPRLLRLQGGDQFTVVATGTRNGPWNGVAYHEGAFYVAEGGQAEGGKILRIAPDGQMTVLLDSLPSLGDHHTNGPAVRDGYVYFGQGTATNSGVVGEDNAEFGWLKRHPGFHEIPYRDITLTGQNFESANVLTPEDGDRVATGAFVPFGTATQPGQVIRGQVPCTGSIMRLPVAGGPPEVVAWGLRNPFGLAFTPEGRLLVTENSYDDRGSRPVWGCGDVLWEIRPDTWYGFPDFSAGQEFGTTTEFDAPGENRLQPLLQHYPNEVPKPAAIFGVHTSATGLDVGRSAAFGYPGQVFVALFGDMAPGVGKVLAPAGFKVVRVDPQTGVVHDFAANKGKKNGPANWIGSGGLERPVAVRFNPAGDALYVVDFGILTSDQKGHYPQTNTGAVWKITKTGTVR